MEDDIMAYLDYCVCRAEFENDEVIWGDEPWDTLQLKLQDDELPPDETSEEEELRKRRMIEELEDFDIPF